MEFIDLKKPNITKVKLKNIDLSEVTYLEQITKVEEEEEEFQVALEGTDKEHIIEEFWDKVQANVGLLTFYGISAKRLMNGYPKHLDKLKSRPRNGK